MTIESAERALRSGDLDGALAVLLDEWRATGSGEVAQLIDEVSAQVTPLVPRLEGASGRERLASWLERARGGRPSDVGVLVADLSSLLDDKALSAAT